MIYVVARSAAASEAGVLAALFGAGFLTLLVLGMLALVINASFVYLAARLTGLRGRFRVACKTTLVGWMLAPKRAVDPAHVLFDPLRLTTGGSDDRRCCDDSRHGRDHSLAMPRNSPIECRDLPSPSQDPGAVGFPKPADVG